MKLGFHDDITASAYHADPCDVPSLTQSIANEMINKSPWHAHRLHPKLGGKSRPSTESKDAGNLMHSLLLGQEHEFAVLSVDDFRTKAAREFRDEAIARGKTPVKKCDFDVAMEQAARIDNELRREHGICLGKMRRELTVVWNEKTDILGQVPVDVLCRARLDAFDGSTVYDLKTCADASTAKLTRPVIQFGYDVQAAAYTSAVERTDIRFAGRVQFADIFIENDTLAINVVRFDGMFEEIGRQRWQECVNVWHECLTSGVWPGYSTAGTVSRLECPEWRRVQNETELSSLRRKVGR